MDRQTFDRLMLQHLPQAQRFAVRLTGDVTSAEDLLHDALIRATKSWQSFRGEASFKTWFYQIVINVFRDRLRGHHETESIDDVDIAGVEPGPVERASQVEVGRLVALEVSRLPPRQREVLVLVAYEQMTPAEAARELSISEENARTNLHLARQKLKRRLNWLFRETDREART